MTAAPRLLSVNIARAAILASRGRRVATGIFKEPVGGPVRLTGLTLEGDVQVDKRFHGGPDRAAYVYPIEHYPYFREMLKRADLSAGFFGENFTTEGLLENAVRIGDVLRIGSAVVQVTAPRGPCWKMGQKAGSPAFVRQMLESRRLGFYLRVLEEGDVAAGDAISVEKTDSAAPTVADDIEKRYFRAA
jgi:MOSC domain-containing protein YiiM